MKLLVVGSKSIHISSFIDAMNDEGIVPFLLTEEKVDYQKVQEEKNVNFHSLNLFKLLFSYFKLKKYIKKLNPDIVNIHQINRMAYFTIRICKRLGIKTVLIGWGTEVIIYPYKNKLFFYMSRKTMENADILIANSIHLKNAMLKICNDKRKYRTLHYGITPIGIGTKENVVYSNRLHKDFYRIDQVIEYFADFQRNHENWRLVVSATGPETENLKEKVKNLGIEERVTFLGWIDFKENEKWFKKSKIYISIPSTDSISVSVLESLSAGCLPVLPDLPVSFELLDKGMACVIESHEENPINLAVNLLNSDYQEQNLKLINLFYNKKVATKKYIDIFESLLTNTV